MLAQFVPYLKDFGLPAIIVLALAGGWLIPRWVYRQMVMLHAKEAAFYKEAWTYEKARSDTLGLQVGQLLQYGQTTVDLLAAWQKATQSQVRES